MYGYARVSTQAQDYAAQVAELEIAGCGQVVVEKVSARAGKVRPELRRVLATLKAGDCLVVTRLNRLARSARDALNTLEAVRARGADFKSLREAWADTTTAHGRLVVTIMSGLAEFDREMILERTAEGREHAKAAGVRMGRKHTLTRRQRAYVVQQRRASPPASLGQLAALLNVSRSTISRASREPLSAGDGADPPPLPYQVDLEDLIGADPVPT